MAPDPNRYKDVVLAPCNASATRRNFSAIRDSLEGIVNELEPTPSEDVNVPQVASELIFFECTATNVGGASVACQEIVWNAGLANWETTGASYTAYDWSKRNAWNPNFRTGFKGVGRLNANIAGDALEIIAMEGYARLVECTLAENMGASTTKEALANVNVYWGDPLNGQNPGAQVTLHDITNMAPNAALNDKALGLYDEKTQRYVYIGPWKGAQTTGQAAIVKCNGGGGAGCDVSSEEDAKCVHSGVLQVVSVGGNFCAEKYTDGAPIWILDGRACHGFTRLANHERYVAVSAGTTFDPDPGGPNTDERALYLVVDFAPPFRWYRILTDSESLALENSTLNNLTCRDHQCAGAQPDDAPSVYGVWEDIDPCTRLLTVLDATATLIYFPKLRQFCDPVETPLGPCREFESNPDCRKNRHILCMWNPVAERWEAIHDAEECTPTPDVSLVALCNQTPNSCCVYDAKRIKYYPRDDSYCDPFKDVDRVWLFCANATELASNWCELSVKICEGFDCSGDIRPVYMHKCGDCTCNCPTPDQPIHFQVKVSDSGPCGHLDGIFGSMHCLDGNPFTSPAGGVQGWYGEFSFVGVIPRLIFYAEPNDTLNYPNGVWLEIAQWGDVDNTPGDILSAWADDGMGGFQAEAIPTPGDYAAGLLDCAVLTLGGIPQYRVHTYRYGLWVECGAAGELTNVQIYWLKPSPSRTLVTPTCDGVQRSIIGDATTDVLSGAETLDYGSRDCCANSFYTCATDLVIACSASPAVTIAIPDLAGAGSGSTSISICEAGWGGQHIIGGCTCAVLLDGTPDCSSNNTACGPDIFCIEFSWQ